MLCQKWKITDRVREEPDSNLHFYNLDFWLLRVNWNCSRYPQGSPNFIEYFDIPGMRFLSFFFFFSYGISWWNIKVLCSFDLWPDQISRSVVSNSFATPWIAARQASLSITNSRSSLKLMSIESVMPSSHLILCRPLLLLPQSLPA